VLFNALSLTSLEGTAILTAAWHSLSSFRALLLVGTPEGAHLTEIVEEDSALAIHETCQLVHGCGALHVSWISGTVRPSFLLCSSDSLSLYSCHADSGSWLFSEISRLSLPHSNPTCLSLSNRSVVVVSGGSWYATSLLDEEKKEREKEKNRKRESSISITLLSRWHTHYQSEVATVIGDCVVRATEKQTTVAWTEQHGIFVRHGVANREGVSWEDDVHCISLDIPSMYPYSSPVGLSLLPLAHELRLLLSTQSPLGVPPQLWWCVGNESLSSSSSSSSLSLIEGWEESLGLDVARLGTSPPFCWITHCFTSPSTSLSLMAVLPADAQIRPKGTEKTIQGLLLQWQWT
jgi:hypothetical protein